MSKELKAKRRRVQAAPAVLEKAAEPISMPPPPSRASSFGDVSQSSRSSVYSDELNALTDPDGGLLPDVHRGLKIVLIHGGVSLGGLGVHGGAGRYERGGEQPPQLGFRGLV
jgi:hypothetical protein